MVSEAQIAEVSDLLGGELLETNRHRFVVDLGAGKGIAQVGSDPLGDGFEGFARPVKTGGIGGKFA